MLKNAIHRMYTSSSPPLLPPPQDGRRIELITVSEPCQDELDVADDERPSDNLYALGNIMPTHKNHPYPSHIYQASQGPDSPLYSDISISTPHSPTSSTTSPPNSRHATFHTVGDHLTTPPTALAVGMADMQLQARHGVDHYSGPGSNHVSSSETQHFTFEYGTPPGQAFSLPNKEVVRNFCMCVSGFF